MLIMDLFVIVVRVRVGLMIVVVGFAIDVTLVFGHRKSPDR